MFNNEQKKQIAQKLLQQIRNGGGCVPQVWKPQPGDAIAGEFLRKEERQSSYNGFPEYHSVVIIEDCEAGHEVAVWLSPTVLRERFSALRPQQGEVIAIRYEGLRPTVSGGEYKHYNVRVARTEPIDWSNADPRPLPIPIPDGFFGPDEMGCPEPYESNESDF